jgi:hypothetical protein
VLLPGLDISTIFSAFPLAEPGMGYGMLFVSGIITSFHCVAMCGSINLSQCLRGDGVDVAAVKGKIQYQAQQGGKKKTAGQPSC